MFSSLKYDQSDTIQKKESEEDDERHSRGGELVFNEKIWVKIKQRRINKRITE